MDTCEFGNTLCLLFGWKMSKDDPSGECMKQVTQFWPFVSFPSKLSLTSVG